MQGFVNCVGTEKYVGVKAEKVKVTHGEENVQGVYLRACGGRIEGPLE